MQEVGREPEWRRIHDETNWINEKSIIFHKTRCATQISALLLLFFN